MPRRSKVEELKNLEVSVAVDGSASLEILRCTQDDIESRCDKETKEVKEIKDAPP